MTIISTANIGLGTLSDRLLQSIPPELQFTLRRLLFVLQTPIDAPGIEAVLIGAHLSVKEFGNSLRKPSEPFLITQGNLLQLCETTGEILKANNYRHLNQPLFRRLSKYPAWGLFLSLSTDTENSDLLKAAGAELIVTYELNRPFSKGYANNLRLIADPSKNFLSNTPKRKLEIERHFQKVNQEALELFEDNASECLITSQFVDSFENRARHHLINKQVFASPRNRQAVLDHRTQSSPQVIHSSAEVREKTVQGSADACLTALAFCSGLSVELVKELPLYLASNVDWFITLELATGLIKTNIESLSPNSAKPTRETATAHHTSNKIIVKPIPDFLFAALNKHYAVHTGARTVGEMLPNTSLTSKTKTISDSESGIAPSIARFLNSAASFAIQHGIDRLSAAIVTNDFSVIPGSKLYYGQVGRTEIWAASQSLFGKLQWGNPVAFSDGLAVGSAVIPTNDAVSNLFLWMADEVTNLRPGKRYTENSIINHHNVFSIYCASLTALCLASREANQYQFTSASLSEHNSFTSLFDKVTGQFPGALPLPVNRILSEQLHLWIAHCRALDARLAKLGHDNNSKLRNHIDAVIHYQSVKLFFQISNQKIIPLGSSHLTKLWPAALKLNANYGRDFWERELHLAGIHSTKIDMLLRHQLMGMESYSSTSNLIQSEWGREISETQEILLLSLGIGPIYGLSKV